MTDWTGGPDPEYGNELDESYGRLDEPAEQEDPVAEEPAPRERGYRGEGELADFDPASGRSSWDDWGT